MFEAILKLGPFVWYNSISAFVSLIWEITLSKHRVAIELLDKSVSMLTDLAMLLVN